MIDNAEKAFASWSKTPVSERADLLCRIADILERHMEELIALCIKEAGKVAQDGIDEVREAVDFCRYYAARAIEQSEDERLEARGVVLCISPWNFPLAIFFRTSGCGNCHGKYGASKTCRANRSYCITYY